METIYLVDDDPAILKSLSRVLGEAQCNVKTFTSAEAFLARLDPDVGGCLVLDVTLPGLDGLALQRRLIESGRVLPIIFLTGYGDIPMSVQAIKAGATDFLTKPVSSATLLHAIRAAIAQDACARQTRVEMATVKQRFAMLTKREREVLDGIVKGRLNKQIASDLGIVEQTVKFHRARIMDRMQAHTVAELMHMAAKLDIEAATKQPDDAQNLDGPVRVSVLSSAWPTQD